VTDDEILQPEINYQDTFNIVRAALEDPNAEDANQDELAALHCLLEKLA
jgi:hypothetical protein